MPVYNQEDAILDIINALEFSTSEDHDLIMVNDGSSDATLERLKEITKIKYSHLREITIINNPVPIYETACDNQGFRISKTDYVMEIQADIYINDLGFDSRMINIMEKFNSGGVSGRLTHGYSLLDEHAARKYPLRYLKRLLKNDAAGLIGDKIENIDTKYKNEIYQGETIVRGPWLLKKEHLESIGYLDEQNFFLGNDDHDLNRRLREKFNLQYYYVPTNIKSILRNGSTRRKRSGLNLKIFNFLKENKIGSTEYIKFLRNYKPYCPVTKIYVD